MRWDMAKKSKKWIKTLKNNGFRNPYQILVDNSFLKIVTKHCIKLSTFKEILKDEPKFFMTKCTYELHKPHKSQNDFSGECEIIKCNHEQYSVNCAHSFIKETNPHHYILATHNIFFINKLKESKHIPVLRIFKSVPRVECFQMDSNVKIHMDKPAGKKELKTLKRMLG